MSLDINQLVRAVKQAAVEAVQAEAPMGFCQGTVTAANPLTIAVDQKIILTGPQLVLTNSVRDFVVDMTVDHETEPVSHGHMVTGTAEEMMHDHTVTGTAGESAVTGTAAAVGHGHTVTGTAKETAHAHPYKGRKSFRVHLALKTGEKVVLLRCDGGQKYIVLDRWEALS